VMITWICFQLHVSRWSDGKRNSLIAFR
jgi:hypothetical protein